MSGMWEKLKKNTHKTKLRGDIVLIEREITSRKKTFGVELYDVLTNDKNRLLGVAAGTLLKGQQDDLQEPFERAREDIAGLQVKKDMKQKDLDVLEVKGAHTLPDTTMNDKLKKAQRSVSNAGTGTKLRAEMALLDREIKIRKEQFGLEAYDSTHASGEKQKKGIAGAVQKTLSGLSQHEQAIQACIDEAKKDVGVLEAKINSKKVEINSLDEEMQALTG